MSKYSIKNYYFYIFSALQSLESQKYTNQQFKVYLLAYITYCVSHTYYLFLSTLDYKFLFNYFQLWRSYAILSATTQRFFLYLFH